MNRTPLDGRLAKVREAGRMLVCLWMTEVERERRAGDSGRSSEWKIHPRSLRITSPLKNHRIDSPRRPLHSPFRPHCRSRSTPRRKQG